MSLLRRAGHRRVLVLLAAATGLAGLLAGAAVMLRDPRPTVAVLSPVYQIEWTSGSNSSTSAPFGIGQPGVPQVPVPVDVDKDLVPDVLVSVNLVNARGLLNNPPEPGEFLAPNIDIARSPVAVAAGKPSPPLTVKVKLTVKEVDAANPLVSLGPDTVFRFGYDTGPGGSIPSDFKALVAGIDEFFNPVTARITTEGYEGPLKVVGSIGDVRGITGFTGLNLANLAEDEVASSLEFGYRPFPGAVEVTYRTDVDGQHVTYAHSSRGEVDLDARVIVRSRDDDVVDRSDFSARVERLPRSVGLDIGTAPDRGSVRYRADADGRLPDVHVNAVTTQTNASTGATLADKPPLVADADVEALPAHMFGEWSFPADGPVHARFDTENPASPGQFSGQGIGAIEARVANFLGAPKVLKPFVPAEQQFLNLQVGTPAGGSAPERIVSGRLERIRSATLDEEDGTVRATVNVGDGERPLLAHVLLDDAAAGKGVVEATTTVAPLPGSVALRFEPGQAGSATAPLRFAYDASESVDIDADARVFGAGVPATAACGDKGTICATLEARHVPTHLEARVLNFPAGGQDESRIEVDAIPRTGGAKPDIFADATIGQDDGIPLVAHAEALGIAEFLRVRAVEGRDETTERAEFHTCKRDYAANACEPGTSDEIGALAFFLRNFRQRPSNLPPAYAATPNFATITARGRLDTTGVVDFEATGRMTSVSELVYINKNVFGARTRIGGGRDFSATVDIQDVDFTGDDAAHGRVDVLGDVLVQPLPATFDFCLKQADQPVLSTPTDPLTAACENPNPFGDPANLTRTPLSLHYDAAGQFDVFTNATVVQEGPDHVGRADDHTIRGRLNVLHVPRQLTSHFLSPKEGTTGPVRARYDAPIPAEGGAQVDVDFGLEVTDADLVCTDPRTPAGTDKAMCAEGVIQHLPTRATLEYDPSKAGRNLVFDSSGTELIDLTGLRLSSVERDPDTGKAKVLVAEGEVLDLPRKVEGTLRLPRPDPVGKDDPVAVDLTATPPLGAVNATVRNYIAPDPFAGAAVPAQRAGLPPMCGPVGPPGCEPYDTVTFRQRGEAFKAEAHVTSVKRAGYRTASTAGPNPKRLDTQVVNVEFGRDKNVRAYVDLLDDASQSVIGDVSLLDVPAGLSLCFRGEKDPANATLAAVDPTFCDTTPSDPELAKKQGAFQFKGEALEAGTELDVHAFVRRATGGGANVISGRVDIENVPPVVQGTFGDGKVDVGGFEADPLTPDPGDLRPDGIDRIGFHVANFDIADHGYADPPFQPRTVTRAPFPARATANQHLGLATDGTSFEVVGRIGEVEGSGLAESDLQRVRVGDTPCTKPTGPGVGTRADFPFFPDATASQTSYTCARVDFEPVGTGADRLDLSAVVLDRASGETISLRDGGLSDVPDFIQLNLAKTPTLQLGSTDPQRPFRTPCGKASETNAADCMPPLVRFDSASHTGEPVLFGTLEVGTAAQLEDLAETKPRVDDMVDVDARADAATWAGDTGPQKDDKGVRAKVGTFTPEGGGASATAARVGVRLGVPESFTLDQVLKWDRSRAFSDNFFDASDLKVHYAVRTKDGDVVPRLGHLAALLHSFPDGRQILLTDGGEVTLKRGDGTTRQGIDIPGELALGVYTRNDRLNGRNFIQLDGRISHEMDLRARLVRGSGEGPALVNAQVVNVPAAAPGSLPGDPSFRLQAEIIGKGEQPPTSGGGGGGRGDDDDDCSPFLCAKVQVDVKAVTALVDFRPGTLPATRLVKAVARTDDGEGLQIQAFDNVAGTGGPSAALTANASLTISPINVFFHAGIPVLGSADFVLLSELNAGVSLDEIQDFAVRHKTLHIVADNVSSKPSGIGPIDFNIYLMHGEAWLLFVKLFGVDFFPPSVPGAPPGVGPLAVPFYDCSVGGLFTDFLPSALPGYANVLAMAQNNTLRVPPGTAASPGHRDVLMWPLDDARLHFSGVLGPLTILKNLAKPFFCLTSPEDIKLITADNPGDPLGPARTGHAVPGAHVYGPAPVAGPAVPTLPDLEVAASQTKSLCGTHAYRRVTISGTVEVATTAIASGGPGPEDDDCPAGSEGTLTLVAENDIVVNSGGRVLADGQSRAIPFNPGDDLVVDPATDARWSTVGATVNSGGGHGGKGGKGKNLAGSGHPGDPYGDDDPTRSFTEAGAPGAPLSSPSSTLGNGGGAITLGAPTVTVNGIVSADGRSGLAGTTGDCQAPDGDDEGTAPDAPNTGARGQGGGSGGGIVINATSLHVGGTVRANGGAGGAGKGGGGGGGGGGIVKVLTPLRTGNAPSAAGGGGGASTCPELGGGGAAGLAGKVVENREPQSRAHPFSGFWQRGSGLKVAFSAAAHANPGNDFQVALCGFHLDPDRPLADGPRPPDDDTDPDGLLFPALMRTPKDQPTITRPCGTYSTPTASASTTCPAAFVCENREATFLGYEKVSDTERVSFDPDHPELARKVTVNTNLANGYEGVYTIVFKPETDGNDCFDVNDFGGGGLGGFLYDAFDCDPIEDLPTSPELVFGIDNDQPGLTVTASPEGGRTASRAVGATIDVEDQPTTPGLSGLKSLTCKELRFDPPLGGLVFPLPTIAEAVDLPGCQAGANAWQLQTAGDGQKIVLVTATDNAGNATSRIIGFTLDVKPPDFTGAADTGPDRANGWYSASPTFRFTGYADPANADGSAGVGAPAAPASHWRYRIDEGGEADCKVPPDGAVPLDPLGCRVVDPLLLPGFGRHSVHYTGVDAVGNRHHDDDDPATPADDHPETPAMKTIPVKIDGVAPTSALLTAPAAPNGANGWFSGRPFVALSAVDQPGGSGLAIAPDEVGGGDDEVAGIFYRLDGGTEQRYTGAFRLTPGSHEVCFRAIDVAGNAEVGVAGVEPSMAALRAANHCRTFLVDDADPAVEIVANPAAPNGQAGWYTSRPTVSVSVSDLGSGVDPTAFPSVIDKVCDARLPATDPRPSGTCVSVDGAPFRLYGGPFVLPEGLHDVRAFATDVAGRRSPIRTAAFMVDLSDPVPSARAIPPAPARNGWWRGGRPRVVLRAVDGDQNAGLSRVKYRLDANPTVFDYTGPIVIPAGTHTVTFWAVDRAGRVAQERRMVLPVDLAPPGAKATTPEPVGGVVTAEATLTVSSSATGTVSATIPTVWVRSPGDKAKLHWGVKDDRSRKLQVAVVVHDELGFWVRRLVHPSTVTVTPGSSTFTAGFTEWDGKVQRILGIEGSDQDLVDASPGLYYYRVVAIDEAGNVAESGESIPLLIKLP